MTDIRSRWDDWLAERERYWRATIGDEAWEAAVAYWQERLTQDDQP